MKTKSKGWFENKFESCLNSKGKSVAPLHHQAAVRARYQKDKTLDKLPFSNHEIVDDIIEETQSKRKESAIANDNSRTAENLGEKDEAEDLVRWVKHPEKTDLVDIDTKDVEEIQEDED